MCILDTFVCVKLILKLFDKMWLNLLLYFIMVQSATARTEYEYYVFGARCQAKCNQKFGVQRIANSKEMLDVYRPYNCGADSANCLSCSKVCHAYHHDEESCKKICKSAICFQSCSDIYRDNFDSEVSSANVMLTKPTVVCKYTPLLPDQDMIDRMLKYRRSSDVSESLGDDNSSLVYLRWNVLDLNGASTSIPLAFVVSLKSRYKNRESTWKTVAFTNFSFVPITGLSPSSEYNFRITVVGVDGIVDKAKDTGWISIPEARAEVDASKSISLIKQYYKGSSVHALMGWTPGKHGGCYFKLYWMKSNHGNYKTQDVKEWSKFEFEISDLDFNSEYIVEVETYDKDFLKSSKPSTKIKFKTLDCLNSTGHDYDICAPDQLSNITLTVGPKHVVDGLEVADVDITWTLPQYISPSNDIEHIFLTWRKEPSIALSKYIIPHHGDRLLSKTAENVTLFGLHWNSVYAITTQVRSPGGISDKTTNHAQLGSAYADINPEEITFEQTTSSVAEQLATCKTIKVKSYTCTSVFGWTVSDRQVNVEETTENSNSNMYFLFVIPIILLSALVVVFLLCRKRSAKKERTRSKIEEVNPLYRPPPEAEVLVSDDTDLSDDFEISMNRLVMSEVLGEGAFGRVFKAVLAPSNPYRNSTGRIVAVKILREHALEEETRNLLLEIEAMKQLGHHKNLISLIACCSTGKDICLVMDYCPLGDLRNFLRSCRESNVLCSPKSTDSGISPSESNGCKTGSGTDDRMHNMQLPYPAHKAAGANIDPSTLLSYARQIVLGMEYLTDKKFVHRDLATRNILLSSEKILKISDFGLTRDVYLTNMYRPTSSRKLPYKWMPLETIFDQIFTMKSDVWSFGIVLWEIVTLGGCPYPGIPNEDLFKLLKDGYRMEKPENCGNELYQMMLACWHPTPSNRPTFKQLHYDLDKLLEATQPYIDLNVVMSEDYYKQDVSSSRSNVVSVEMQEQTESAEDFTRIDWFKSKLITPNYDCKDVFKPNNSMSDLPSCSPVERPSVWRDRSKSSCELRIGKSNHLSKKRTSSKEALIKSETRDYRRPEYSVENYTNIPNVDHPERYKAECTEQFVGPDTLECSGEHSPNLSISDEESIESNSSLATRKGCVFQTPSLKHGLLNQLSRVGRRRLGSSEYKHSFSLTEVSNIDKDNRDIKVGSMSAVM